MRSRKREVAVGPEHLERIRVVDSLQCAAVPLCAEHILGLLRDFVVEDGRNAAAESADGTADVEDIVGDQCVGRSAA